MFPRCLIWPIFTLFMGFAIGGSVFWGLYGANTTIEQANAAHEHRASSHETTTEKEKADEALARYTFWLTLFTGVLAFATIGLGVATVGLYLTGEKAAIATEGAAKAAILDARTAILSQAPVVFITDIGMGDRGTERVGDGPRKRIWMTYGPKNKFRIRVRFRNFGRTPAIVEGICLDYVVSASLAEVPRYQNIKKAVAAIRPDKGIKIIEPPNRGYIELSKGDLLEIEANTKSIWIYGFIHFVDFLHTRYEIGFCGSCGQDGSFTAGGPANYIYERVTPQTGDAGRPT